MSGFKYNRVMLKVSGEGLANSGSHGVDSEAVTALAEKIKRLSAEGVELVIVVGGGNFVRGSQLRVPNLHRATGDYMGMLATVMNAIALQDTLESIGVPTRVQSALDIDRVCEKWIRRKAVRHLEKGRVVILAAGLGSPGFTTDSAAAQRAVELDCEILVKATQVDGVYDSDPKTNPDAKKYDRVTYNDVLAKELRVMDATAIAFCREHHLPILVSDINDEDGLLAAFRGESIGTLVTSRG